MYSVAVEAVSSWANLLCCYAFIVSATSLAGQSSASLPLSVKNDRRSAPKTLLPQTSLVNAGAIPGGWRY
jgi:hypothetical protein